MKPGVVAALVASHGPTKRAAAVDGLFRRRDAPRADEEWSSRIRPVGTAGSDLCADTLAAGFDRPAGAYGSLMGGSLLGDPCAGHLAFRGRGLVATGLGV